MTTPERPVSFGPSIRRLLRRMAPERARLVGTLVLALGSVGAAVAAPKVLAEATDLVFAGLFGRNLGAQGVTKEQAIAALDAEGEHDLAAMLRGMDVVPGVGVDFGALATVLLLVLAIYAVSAAAGWLQGWLVNDVVQRTLGDLRRDVAAKVNRLPLRYVDGQSRGELLSRVSNDVDNLGQSLQQTLSQLVTAVLTVVGVIAMMFWISPLLALIALVSVPVTAVLTGIVMGRSQGLFAAQWRDTGELNAHIEEVFSGHALVRVFGLTREMDAEFRQRSRYLHDSAFGAQFVSGLIMPLMMFVGNLNYVVIAVVGGLRVANGTMSLGDVQAFIQYSRQFTQPLTQLASMANLLQSGVASAERVFELLDAEEESPEPARRAGVPQVAARGAVRFEGVSFSYDPARPLITGLDLDVRPGQTVAIVGPTGAGKTTLVNLVMRFYELDEGRITLDGQDIALMARREVRVRTGMVLQDTWLFSGTIRDNIAYGRPSATEEEILAAARATFVDRFVHSLPDGYDTWIEEDAANLSAGERQLITIARAFLADPALLILDEATSSVDTRTELLLQQAMAALRSDRTSFVIAHRLSTIRDADLILVMEAGRIVEQGTHASLLAADGAYAALYRSQFEAPVGDPAA